MILKVNFCQRLVKSSFYELKSLELAFSLKVELRYLGKELQLISEPALSLCFLSFLATVLEKIRLMFVKMIFSNSTTFLALL